jgi:hypothetical protein
LQSSRPTENKTWVRIEAIRNGFMAEQVLPGSERVRGEKEGTGGGNRGEKWSKQCIHI